MGRGRLKEHANLKYAVRAGSDIAITATVSAAGQLETRGGLKMRRLEVTDGHTTMPPVVFGDAVDNKYRAGQRMRTVPVYCSSQWGSFSLRSTNLAAP